MKMRTVVIIAIAVLYGIVMFFILNPDVYGSYVDYYLFRSRVFSRHDENVFDKHQLPGSIELFKTYRVGSDDPRIAFIGFSSNQTSGRWTHGKFAKMAFELPAINSDVIVRFRLNPYVNTHNPKVTVKVFVNNQYVDEWFFREKRANPRTEFTISKKFVEASHRITVSFRIEGVASPKQLGYGNNTNKLGFFLKEFEVIPNPRTR